MNASPPPKVELTGFGPTKAENLRITSFENRIEIREESWTAAVDLHTNGAPPVEIVHQVLSTGDTESTLALVIKKGTRLTIIFDAIDDERECLRPAKVDITPAGSVVIEA